MKVFAPKIFKNLNNITKFNLDIQNSFDIKKNLENIKIAR